MKAIFKIIDKIKPISNFIFLNENRNCVDRLKKGYEKLHY